LRLIVTSDTHLGITTLPRIKQLVTDIASHKPDAVAIAGDIGEGIENVEIVLGEFSSIGVPVCAVSGNHDVWNHDRINTSLKMWETLLPKVAKASGTTWLENEILIVGDIAIVGTNGWYDYSAQEMAYRVSPDENFKRKGEFDADAWKVDWPWNDIEFCALIEPGFRKRLKEAQENERVREMVVISHSLLFEEQIKRKPDDFRWGFSNAYYGNLTFGRIVSEHSKVTHVVSGHSHFGMDAVIDMNGHPARVITLDSQYNNPAYVILDLPAELFIT